MNSIENIVYSELINSFIFNLQDFLFAVPSETENLKAQRGISCCCW